MLKSVLKLLSDSIIMPGLKPAIEGGKPELYERKQWNRVS